MRLVANLFDELLNGRPRLSGGAFFAERPYFIKPRIISRIGWQLRFHRATDETIQHGIQGRVLLLGPFCQVIGQVVVQM